MKIQIALADDHHLIRGGIKLLLEQFSEFKVTVEASNGSELLVKLRTIPQRPHIALIDIGMPILNGFDTCNILNSEFPEIKVIALSIFDDSISINKMIDSGANAYLLKDSFPEVVKETILHVYNKGYYYSQLVVDSILNDKQDKISNQRSQGGTLAFRQQLESLTGRELEFVKNCCSEKTYKEIADNMHVSQRTVDGYRDSIFSKLELKSRTGIVLFAIRNQLVSL